MGTAREEVVKALSEKEKRVLHSWAVEGNSQETSVQSGALNPLQYELEHFRCCPSQLPKVTHLAFQPHHQQGLTSNSASPLQLLGSALQGFQNCVQE